MAGPNAPTAENLKSWLQKNPTFEVVRPGTLSTIKPNAGKKKSLNEPHKIQTTLPFERIPKKSDPSTPARIHQPEQKEKPPRILPSPKEERIGRAQPTTREERLARAPPTSKEERLAKALATPKEERIATKSLTTPKEERIAKTTPKEEVKQLVQPRTPVTPKSQPSQFLDTPKASTSFAKTAPETRKLARATANRSQSAYDKVSYLVLFIFTPTI